MRTRTLWSVVVLAAIAATAVGRSGVVTLSKSELEAAVAAACNSPYAPRGPLHVHRNSAGNMIYVVAEGEREAVIYAQSQSCNELSSDTLDLWRIDGSGIVAGQLANRFGNKRLLFGSSGDGMGGQRFDIDRSGQYFILSRGADGSSLSAVNKPYVRILELPMDAQRIFGRRGGLLVVGNTSAGQLVGQQIRLEAGQHIAEPPVPIGTMPAGVKVLDYNEATDELLLGGVDATGRTSFVTFDLQSGQASNVETTKPDAETALFISDGNLRAKFGGSAAPAGPAPSDATQEPRKRRGFLGIFGRD